jgi:hypothetical protein
VSRAKGNNAENGICKEMKRSTASAMPQAKIPQLIFFKRVSKWSDSMWMAKRRNDLENMIGV